MILSSQVTGQVMDFDPFAVRSNADSSMQYGALIETSYGKDNYRHGKVGAANVGRSKLQLAPAPKANHSNILVAAAAAINQRFVTVTLGATAAVNGEYDQGHMAVVDNTGEGQTFMIDHNPAANASAACRITLLDQIPAALDTTSEVTLVHNEYNQYVEAAVKTRRASGVALINQTAGYFGWLKTRGVCSVLGGSAVTLGASVSSDGTTPGAVTDNTDVTAPQTEVIVGQASIVAGVTGEEFPIVLSID